MSIFILNKCKSLFGLSKDGLVCIWEFNLLMYDSRLKFVSLILEVFCLLAKDFFEFYQAFLINIIWMQRTYNMIYWVFNSFYEVKWQLFNFFLLYIQTKKLLGEVPGKYWWCFILIKPYSSILNLEILHFVKTRFSLFWSIILIKWIIHSFCFSFRQRVKH